MAYIVRQAFPGSHHIYNDENLIAKIEQIDTIKKNLLPWLPKKQSTAFVITHLPGTEKHQFLTLSAAAEHAVYHHFNNKHLDVEHPINTIENHVINLKDAIMHAASDPRMEDDDSQIKLLDISKDSALLHQKIKKHFKGEKE